MKIFLLGFMGSGKTHWGNLWAKKTNLQFFDLDAVIEKKENKTIAQIFEQNGEQYFRQIETEALLLFANKNNCIIATGGGTPCFNNNMHWMNENGITIYLKTFANEIFDRLITEQDKRPLIKNLSPTDLKNYIENKLIEREVFYNKAKLILTASTILPNTINTILKHE